MKSTTRAEAEKTFEVLFTALQLAVANGDLDEINVLSTAIQRLTAFGQLYLS